MPRKPARKWSNVPLVDVPEVAVPEVSPVAGPPADAVAAVKALMSVRDELRALDERRRELLERRDELVAEVRADGVPWSAVEALAGASRPALAKRAPVVQASTAWWFA